MCSTCGCNQPDEAIKITLIKEGQSTVPMTSNPEHHHHHNGQNNHHPHHHHGHDGQNTALIELEKDILSQNNLTAAHNRGYFEAKNILACNLVSSPGSGKTALLERTLTDLKKELSFYVVEGDQQTNNDAMRIHATGAPVVQVNTGKVCHLDADMVHEAVHQLKPAENAVFMIENVGNLVCPSLFDLGENKRIVIMSVTEGDDKPIKYPEMFHSADVCIINKIDLLPYVSFDVEKAKDYALQVNHHLEFFELSATTGEGMDQWYQWLKNQQSKGNE